MIASTLTVISLVASLARAAAGDEPAAPPPAAPGASSQRAAEGAAAIAPPQGGDDEAPPPGTPADQALWRKARATNNDVVLKRTRASRLQLQARTGEYDARLGALAKRLDGAAAPRAEEVRQRVLAEWSASVQLLSRPWPVDPTRACQYELMTFESAMHAAAGRKTTGELRGSRHDLEECLERAAVPLAALDRSTRRLEAALSDADALLATAVAQEAAK